MDYSRGHCGSEHCGILTRIYFPFYCIADQVAQLPKSSLNNPKPTI